MSKTYIPAHYHTPLNVYEMQRAIEFIKSNFQVNLSNALNLRRVSAPLFVEENSGLNDNLNGVERPVSFDIPDVGHNAQVVQSLAKWKRLALKRYEFNVGKGLFTDMNAIRRDEEVDNLHSIYVDQWDWEKVIDAGDRNVSYLKRTVRDIVGAIVETTRRAAASPSRACTPSSPATCSSSPRRSWRTSTPTSPPSSARMPICREHGTVFLMQIGLTLHSGIKHDGRAPDYDDWTLNGDLLFWNDVLGRAFEISSMGIRVEPRVPRPPAHRLRLRRPSGAPLPQDAARRRAAPHHGRRHRSEPSLYADDRHRPHRRGAGQPLGRRHPQDLRGRRHSAAVSAHRNRKQRKPRHCRGFLFLLFSPFPERLGCSGSASPPYPPCQARRF